jgi:hypothetical protein
VTVRRLVLEKPLKVGAPLDNGSRSLQQVAIDAFKERLSNLYMQILLQGEVFCGVPKALDVVRG